MQRGKVSHCSSHHSDFHLGPILHAGLVHFGSAFHHDTVHTGRATQGNGTTDKVNFGTQCSKFCCQGITHFPAGAVADEAHRIDGFVRRTGGDQHRLVHQILRSTESDGQFEDAFGFHHPTGAAESTGQFTIFRESDIAAMIEHGLHICLGCRIFPHVDIHRRGQQNRATPAEINGSEQVIASAVRELGKGVGGKGRYDE